MESFTYSHQLQVFLGAPNPKGKRSLYYQNTDQTVKLDFTGWHQISLDLEINIISMKRRV